MAELNPIFGRMVRALSFDEGLYSEVADDANAISQAGMIVVAGAMAQVVGTDAGTGWFLMTFMVRMLAWWLALSGITYLVGTRVFPPQPKDFGAKMPVPGVFKVARVMGFAMTPRLFRVLTFIPAFGPIIFYLVAFWQIGLMLMAVRLTFGYSGISRSAWVLGVGLVPLMMIEPFILGGV